ncbi:PcfJ domain-containing protein [Gimesia aquarii]|nr:PcfJ domain-containing protein [Gimesia aquarii]
MSKKKFKNKRGDISPDLREHIQALNLRTVEEYRKWCDQHGFCNRTNKTWKVLYRERVFYERTVEEEKRIQEKRKQNKLNGVIKDICRGHLLAKDVSQPEQQILCALIQENSKRRRRPRVKTRILERVLEHLEPWNQLFRAESVIPGLETSPFNTYLGGLIWITGRHADWIRPIEKWKPQTNNAHQMFASLLRHLFAKYEVPRFLDSVWFLKPSKEARLMQKWYLNAGRGIRIPISEFPIPYTRKMLHQFLQAPHRLNIYQAIRYGQIKNMGGSEQQIDAMLATRLGRSFEDESFWVTVIRWFIAHPMLDPAKYESIMEYIQYHRFGSHANSQVQEERDQHPPLLPNFTIRDRRPETLLDAVEDWHREIELRKEDKYLTGVWNPSTIDEFEMYEGSDESNILVCWTIHELLDADSLYFEGQTLNHCVSSYAARCEQGSCSIWSLECETFDGRMKVLTIEVANSTKSICEVRGKSNRDATAYENQILKRWANQAGLNFSLQA